MIILGAPVRPPLPLFESGKRLTLNNTPAICVFQGAGKGTQSEWLLQKYSIETIVVGQLLRHEIVKGSTLGQFAEKKMKAGGAFSLGLIHLSIPDRCFRS